MKKQVKIALIVTGFMFAIGLILVFSSGAIGDLAGQDAIFSNGGSMGTAAYERIVNATTTNFQIAGGIVSLIGGFGVLLNWYFFCKDSETN
ncbi:MAG: hypothetical protein LKK00_08835 [Intestinimonas sp.]|nr:hypothetical protein [Intestinimonas sp.]